MKFERQTADRDICCGIPVGALVQAVSQDLRNLESRFRDDFNGFVKSFTRKAAQQSIQGLTLCLSHKL